MTQPEGPRRSRYVHIVSAAFSNPDPKAPRRALRRYDPRAPAGPTLLRDMERACRNALGGLPALPEGDASPVTHLFGITLPDRDFSVNALHAFYDFKARLALGQRCQVRLEVGSSDAGAVLLASALRLLQGLDEPATALVVAGQEIAPDARRNVRDFVGQVIDARERAAGLNMIPLGDMVMDTIAHRAAITPGALPVLLRGDAVRELLSLWTRRKLRYGETYAPAQRGPAPAGAWSRAQGRWLGSQDMAAASVGACAVLLSTDPEVIARAAPSSGATRPRRVRVLGVGEGDARPAVTERGEPLIFYKSMRQSLSELRRATGTNLDFLRASGFAVLHDAFPSIELALLASLGFSPTDAAQRAASWWPNPRGGLMACGHAFAASGLVQVAQAFHTLTRPPAFDAAPPPPPLARLVASPRPVHCVTASVGGPLSHVVTTLLQSVAAGDDDDAPFDPPPRHRRDPGDVRRFEEKSAWVVAIADRYREALAHSCATDLRRGVLEARSVLRLDTLVTAMLPLPFPSREAWASPRVLRYRDRAWAIPDTLRDEVFARLTRAPEEAGEPPVDGAAGAPRRVFVSDDDLRLRASLEACVNAAATEMLAAARGDGEDPLWSASELRDELLCALGVPVGIVATDASAERPHALVLMAVDGRSADEIPVGAVLEIAPSAGLLAPATRVVEGVPGLVPPWYAAPVTHDEPATEHAALAPRIEAVRRALRTSPSAHEHIASLRALAEEGAAVSLASPHRAPPAGLVSLFHALVLDPDEDRDAMVLALDRWRAAIGSHGDGARSVAPDAPLGVAATCLVDIVGAGDRSLTASVGQLQVVARAMRRAEAWLAGARVEHARIADAFCLTAWLPEETSLDDPSVWTALVTYARDVYQHCLDHDVAARILVTAGRALPFHEIDASSLGAVSAAGFALNGVLRRCRGARFDEHFEALRRDGVVAVLDVADARRIGAASEPRDERCLAAAFDAIWRVEGERLRPVIHRGEGARAEGACGELRSAGNGFAYQFRQRASEAPRR